MSNDNLLIAFYAYLTVGPVIALWMIADSWYIELLTRYYERYHAPVFVSGFRINSGATKRWPDRVICHKCSPERNKRWPVYVFALLVSIPGINLAILGLIVNHWWVFEYKKTKQIC